MTRLRYNPVIAKPYLCVAAVLEMIVGSENIDGLDQIAIAEYFGINIPADTLAPISNFRVSGDPSTWGIVIPPAGLGAFFEAFRLPLTETYKSITTLQDWQLEFEFEKALAEQKHIVCGFAYQALFGSGEPQEGHVSLVVGLAGHEKVTLLDPGPKDPGGKVVDVIDLYRAIRARSDGLWLVSR